MPLEKSPDADAVGGASTREEHEQVKDEAAEPVTDYSHSQATIRHLRDVDHHIRSETRRQILQLQKTQEIAEQSRGRDDDTEENDEDSIRGGKGLSDSYGASYDRAAARSPAVNSGYLPTPWHGRLGYGPLNTYLRAADHPVFSSRTCDEASLIDHRYPLQKPSEPEDPITNRPDKSKTPDVARGERYLKELSLANMHDIAKMVRWNDKFGIKFLKLESGMCPFASHSEYGYKLEPFAAGVLAEAGKVIAELGHRVATLPGQHTQLGSSQEEVIASTIRDLEYHNEMLSLLNLPPRQDRDAIIIIHMDRNPDDKEATLDRFQHNYTTRLSPSARARLVLENDDVSWGVHDLLPICEKLSIPLMLNYQHHNIVFDSRLVREGTLDISQPALRDRIAATWTPNDITQSMHYSESEPGAITDRDRRKHANRVATLPPCPPHTDLLVEAKDEEQAVFELMRNFKLPGFEKINDMIPHKREDENRPSEKVLHKGKRGDGNRHEDEDEGGDEEATQSETETVPPREIAMGGPYNRVFWPVGKRDWVVPDKRE
ncbi:hypothetical protein V2G26_012191 [Clonostachys chloroleuca]